MEQKVTTTILTAYPIIGSGRIKVEFTEQGWRVIEDTRSPGSIGGYLHIEDGLSAAAVTDACRNQMVWYWGNHPEGTPGLGATPQSQYMQGLSIEERESIAMRPKGYYA